MSGPTGRRSYLWAPVLVALLAVALGAAYVAWSKGGPGSGLYSRFWSPEPVQAWWDPDRFYRPVQSVVGVFETAECLLCHEGMTPGIVADWRASRHAAPGSRAPVGCPDCHGADHQRLRLPTPGVCGECHGKQHRELREERRYGFPSHALAMERVVDARHFADKPKAEVMACVQCHSVATKCDSCHTRHRFDPAEARRPEACITCHSGPPHPDDDTYFASAHGRLYREEGDGWDWGRPLARGNYPAPTCAYCHMEGGRHQVAHKSLWKFGLTEVNPHTAANQVLRGRWVAVCTDCHAAGQARTWLAGLDAERKVAWKKLYAAEEVLKGLRADDLLHPGARERPPYPLDGLDALWPRARIGYFEGQASAFYNVSALERDYFEMWYFDSLGAYKSAAHGDADGASRWHVRLDRALAGITARGGALRALGEAEQARDGRRVDPGDLWLTGPYTELNRERN
jgi:hydroxylamine dehydrogenase